MYRTYCRKQGITDEMRLPSLCTLSSAGAQIAALLATDGRYLAARQMHKRDIAGVIGLAGAYDFLPLRDATLERVFPPDARAASPDPVHPGRRAANVARHCGERHGGRARQHVPLCARVAERR